MSIKHLYCLTVLGLIVAPMALNPGLAYAGETENTDKRLPLYRLYSPHTGDHFHSVSLDERDRATANFRYVYEGLTGYVHNDQIAGTEMLWRLYNRDVTDHFLTTSMAERDSAMSKGYELESVIGYIHPVQITDTKPVYRLYNRGTVDHFFTDSLAEKDRLVASGWVFEGITGYVHISSRP